MVSMLREFIGENNRDDVSGEGTEHLHTQMKCHYSKEHVVMMSQGKRKIADSASGARERARSTLSPSMVARYRAGGR